MQFTVFRQKSGSSRLSSFARTIINRDCFASLAMTVVFVTCFLSLATSASAQTDYCKASDFSKYQERYGFNSVDNTREYSFSNPTSSQFSQAFLEAREKAIKYAPLHSVDPVLPVWWVFYETGGKKDSFSYSNCINQNSDVNFNCPATSSGAWQLGYGQQFSTYTELPKAFSEIYGDADSAQKTQEVGQKVYESAGQEKEFPERSVNQIISDYEGSEKTDAESRYLISVLMRDPDLSMYLLSFSMKGYESQEPKLKERMELWSGYYRSSWQNTSNLMNDVLIAWNSSACSNQTSAVSSQSSGSNTGTKDPDCDSKDLSSHEAALCNLNKGTLPDGLSDDIKPVEEPWWQKILSSIPLFNFKINVPAFFASRAEVKSNAEVPESVSSPVDDQAQTTANDLGKESGVYAVDLPEQLKNTTESVCDTEQKFANANFPEGVNPFGNCQ